MKSIEDTLKTIHDIIKAYPADMDIALIGGYAVILQGIERTTLDIDFCVYSGIIHSSADSSEFYKILLKCLPERFEAKLIKGSAMPDDPLQHDVIFIEDKKGEFLRIDFLIARYKWELEAIQCAEKMEDIPFPVITKPYLAAMKLKASGFKDASDVVNLVRLMTDEEKLKTFDLAKRIGRDRKLRNLLSRQDEPPDEIKEELI